MPFRDGGQNLGWDHDAAVMDLRQRLGIAHIGQESRPGRTLSWSSAEVSPFERSMLCSILTVGPLSLPRLRRGLPDLASGAISRIQPSVTCSEHVCAAPDPCQPFRPATTVTSRYISITGSLPPARISSFPLASHSTLSPHYSLI
nr:hypothetical protein CFP56_25842 [Quercus suber]